MLKNDKSKKEQENIFSSVAELNSLIPSRRSHLDGVVAFLLKSKINFAKNFLISQLNNHLGRASKDSRLNAFVF